MMPLATIMGIPFRHPIPHPGLGKDVSGVSPSSPQLLPQPHRVGEDHRGLLGFLWPPIRAVNDVGQHPLGSGPIAIAQAVFCRCSGPSVA